MSASTAPGWLGRLDAAAKRGFDLALAAAALALLWPLLLALALWVRLDSPGPAFYRALRVGRDGRSFTMLKFRTMVVGADSGAGVTGAGDARVTRAGRRLRRTRLDELPQLINVLVGEMSLVGPRPESPRYVRYYTLEQLAVLTVRPGVTGPTQLRFRDEAALLTEADVEAQYVRELLPAKLASDLDYVRRRTLLGDIVILVKTAGLALARA
jgi:lipopolysaccharide/colanic/teichoic acid biosynthesis glycosyltransferase